MLAMLMALFQTAPAPQSVPTAPPAPPAPPMVSVPPPYFTTRSQPVQRAKPYLVDVDASAGGLLLWRGTLRVGYPSGASFNRTLSEAPPEGCVATDETRYASTRDSFRITINTYSSADTPRQMVALEWQRPNDDCSSAVITRSVQLSGVLSLQPGQSQTLTGDAGLKVRLTRR